MPETATLTYDAGLLVRGQVKRALTKFAWESGLQVSFEEARAFSVSSYRVTFTGRNAPMYARRAAEWIETIGD